MKFKYLISLVFVCLIAGTLLLAPNVDAAGAMGKVTQFKGDVIIISGRQIYKLAEVGTTLYEGDLIQTKDGGVEIAFNDGALMRVQPYSSTMIQEGEEEVGWLFKTRKKVRRLTVFVGRFWFNSRKSKRKSFLQTPTAVCGLRGTEGCISFDLLNSVIQLAIGKADLSPGVIKGVCAEIDQAIAANSEVYNSVVEAFQAHTTATTDQEKDAAYIKMLIAIKTALSTLVDNNNYLSEEAQLVLNIAIGIVNEELRGLTETYIEAYDEPPVTFPEETTTEPTTATTTTVYGG